MTMNHVLAYHLRAAWNKTVAEASGITDLDLALKPVQEALGVTSGDFAGVWFSGDPDSFNPDWTMANNWEEIWPMLSDAQRESVIRAYAAAESAWVEGAAANRGRNKQ